MHEHNPKKLPKHKNNIYFKKNLINKILQLFPIS